ncbi:RbsD/FucU domain-containing protein, partial [Staphylococcus epidermidis]|uniref:RbsD/FucU domain-containing protein n=1 Tax=Staphylococcus epidermidis TaxID=1282 RepID=UPI0037DA19FF
MPNHHKPIHLPLTNSFPSFIHLFHTLLTQIQIQKIYLPQQIKTPNPHQLKPINKLINHHLQIKFIPHSHIKQILKSPLNK